ncbi:MAG: hypothetical protein HY000_33185 [Planctomycetes bacterium]|nr:hypothetical protein [Planctomycetota bacterium]
MRITATVALALLFNGAAITEDKIADSTRPISRAGTILAVYTQDHGLDSSGTPRLILGVWGDGHLV